MKKLEAVRKFFVKKRDYEVYGEAEDSQLNAFVAEEESSLHTLIQELNEYTRKNHGTTDFSIIQNKTERKINVMYENATSKLAFPTYLGLMGTFLGVFCGLLSFNWGLFNSVDGITDSAISNLIWGVLVSMLTSFIGLLLTTISNHVAADTQKIVGEDKNEFYEFIQNELMPTLGVSMVAALNKLHHTINLFEPSFNKVIDRFQATFDSCTQRFGSAFEQNVTIVSEAVRVMGENMDKINENVDLQAQLLKTLRSRGVVESLDAFVRASQNFDLVTTALNRFEVTRNAIKDVTVELVNTQRRYNESLEIPLNVANKLNQILSRITDFEKSINALGRNIEKTDLLGNTEIEALKQAITAIKKKQKVAVEAMEVSDGHLENIFKMQSESIVKLGRTYEESFAYYAEKFQNILDGLEKEMLERRREIVAAIEEKFSLDQIQQEFSQLSKLKKIEELLTSINTKSSREEVDKTIETTRHEVESIRKLLDKAIEDAKKKPETPTTSGGGGFLGGIFGGRK
ncbi:hypothetical protein [Bacteroides muris (ex Fokt et al. 2023)]|uniref:Uncharacterized protein n=1 Tax=Bacteroides muris (ex Fokt et al. 2023) TaxID=2937417 RepID=A0A9X2NR60_9BACE|nr:hypothetical protein [Bacteroides muris (ex Fokt et al. 2023)]MCR6504638.1 hypothetical protein [Bacteroides muris (ex Fokt et al. 2023)]